MIVGFLSGTLKDVYLPEQEVTVVSDCGIGYSLVLPVSYFSRISINQRVEFFVKTVVKEGDIQLYGFFSPEEKRLFNLLTRVNKVGPKLALEIIAAADAEAVLSAIVSEDVSFFNAVKGIGKKTAERIILELKDKVELVASNFNFNVVDVPSRDSTWEEARVALMALEFPQNEVEAALKSVYRHGMNSEEVVSAAIKWITGRR